MTKRLTWIVSLGLAAGVGPAAAQEVPVDVRRAQASRAELEAALVQLDQVTASSGYSKSFRQAKEGEAAMVRQRLAEGDFQVGDQIVISVVGESGLTGTFPVLSGRILSMPELPPISLEGVLRSEVRDHLTTEIGKYVKDPQITVQGSYIRVAIMGAVGKPGYYQLPADNLITDAIMAAGGPGGNPDMEKSVVRRAGKDVISGAEIQTAIENGESLDQLNLHGGDELVIGGKRGNNNNINNRGGIRNWLWPLQIATSVGFLLTRLF